MTIGCRAQQLVANKCFGKCSVRSAEYRKRVRPICTFSKNVIQQKDEVISEYYHRTLYTSKKLAATPRLSPQEVTNILRANEHTQEFTTTGSVKSYDSNQLSSNNPIEDTRTEAQCLLTKGLLLGVFDGHGGASCAQVIAKRLFHYITACLLPPDILHKYLNALENNETMELLDVYNDKVELVDELKILYEASFKTFVKELSQIKDNQRDFQMKEAMEKAFLRLDYDLSKEALYKNDGKVNMKTLSVAMSGAVACVAHIDGPHLHIASIGDCQSVLGVLTDDNTWTAKKLTTEHNTDNQEEIERIFKEHPNNERDTVIKMERLLGQLAPLRAFGDFRYKWNKSTLSSTVLPHYGESVIPPNYYTPPYLTARPEVKHHRLTPRDKFLVIASDGLWDLVSPLQVVRLVGEHMSGKVTLSPFRLPRKDMRISDINNMLLQRKEGLKMKPIDRNAATHLMRNALGGTEYGIDHVKLSQLLSMPQELVRVFRDDITITVTYFDSEYLRHCPP
ncbi:hypothetical protein B7P43_G16694 [Cryptotermes secundus]|uniref:PPM-type phosphatase domain-containing protein n=1 Tax=Cryptotermes secundus TaxID=105785 RepID=A0A2J7REN1_9NEOP|nr:pyruvate dehydrogenase [acetyl-transferring]-phosphatase 1, mitochondrial isoform X1 [Cryptotermes secundus]PNF39289.1 hypothetical protein B7P43_G16694 [Cryptotermes secundus]